MKVKKILASFYIFYYLLLQPKPHNLGMPPHLGIKVISKSQAIRGRDRPVLALIGHQMRNWE
jgi:hypothetical protein